MKRSFGRICFMVLLLFLFISLSVSASNPRLRDFSEISIDQLMQETNAQSNDSQRITVLFWVPIEFWKATFHQDPNLNVDTISKAINVLEDYILVGVIDGRFGPFGGIVYSPEEEIRGSLQTIDDSGKVHRPLNDNEIEINARIFLKEMITTMRLVVGENMGEFGKHMNFYVFSSGKVNATEPGRFSIALGDEQYSWHLPLASLFYDLICPRCGEKLPANYSYCPWDGNAL